MDKFNVPPELSYGFTEKLLYLPNIYQSNDMILTVPLCHSNNYINDNEKNDCRRRLLNNDNNDNNDKILLCNFNAYKKFEPTVVHLWSNIMKIITNSALLLINYGNTINIINQFLYYGINLNRIIFIEKVNTINNIDVLLLYNNSFS